MDQFKETVYEDKPIEMEGMYRLLQIDAWAEPEGGWTWNQWWKIEDNIYYTTNKENGIIFKQDLDGDVGDEVGRFVNGVAKFNDS